MLRALLLLASLSACAESSGATPQRSAAKPAPPSVATEAADNRTACVQVVLVQHNGGTPCADCVEREPAEAARRARELQQRLDRGADFAELARSESDAPFGAGGVVGTFRKHEWPHELAAVRDAVFTLKVGQVAPQPLEIDFGYVLVRRCAD
jgi:hypothetical protein